MTQVYLYLRSLILPLQEINQAIPKKGRVVDLGCGQGQVTDFLSATKTRNVLGIDLNIQRLQESKRKNLKFQKGDITKVNLKNINGAIVSDVLHHLSIPDQNKLIKNVFQSLNSSGVFVIKEIDTGEFVRSKLSRMWDFLFYPKDEINFRNAYELKNFLKKVGFKSITITRPCRFFPGSTTLFVCKK